jgi:hypothetical protein
MHRPDGFDLGVRVRRVLMTGPAAVSALSSMHCWLHGPESWAMRMGDTPHTDAVADVWRNYLTRSLHVNDMLSNALVRRLVSAFLCILALVLPACQFLTPQQRNAAQQTIEAEYDAGRLTPAQRDAALEALDEQGGIDWEALVVAGGSVLTSVLLGVPIAVGRVRRERGPSATAAERAKRRAAAC